MKFRDLSTWKNQRACSHIQYGFRNQPQIVCVWGTVQSVRTLRCFHIRQDFYSYFFCCLSKGFVWKQSNLCVPKFCVCPDCLWPPPHLPHDARNPHGNQNALCEARRKFTFKRHWRNCIALCLEWTQRSSRSRTSFDLESFNTLDTNCVVDHTTRRVSVFRAQILFL